MRATIGSTHLIILLDINLIPSGQIRRQISFKTYKWMEIFLLASDAVIEQSFEKHYYSIKILKYWYIRQTKWRVINTNVLSRHTQNIYLFIFWQSKRSHSALNASLIAVKRKQDDLAILCTFISKMDFKSCSNFLTICVPTSWF